MLDVKKEIVERKLLSQPCWINLTDEIRLRIDYPTHSQETELRRLRAEWQYRSSSPTGDHWIEYHIRATVKEVEGFSIEHKPAVLEVKNGLARELVAGEDRLDFVHVLSAYGLLEGVLGLIYEKLNVTKLEKKSSTLPPDSSVQANLKKG